jgi:hypothetical protein
MLMDRLRSSPADKDVVIGVGPILLLVGTIHELTLLAA